jgi:NhaP-type Na+/H+ or K+/H+ antiporter
MVLFDSVLTLLLVALVLLQISRKVSVPYPTMLALAGVGVAALPWAPSLGIDPKLALALFIAPALVDTAFDLPPRAVRRDWVALVALAVGAVLITTIAVAWVGVVWGGLPLAAAVALGAIVAPPDAAAAAAMLARFTLPRRTVSVLKGESLLNDAVALLVFGAAVGMASPHVSLAHLVPELILAAPGGLLFGFVMARIYIVVAEPMTGTLGSTLFQFVSTFGLWVLAERLHISAVLTLVAYAMTVARIVPERTPASDRVHSYAVWEVVVFVLNVLAFLLLGLQARAIVARLPRGVIWQDLRFAGLVLLVVVLVRIAWVMLYNLLRRCLRKQTGERRPPTVAQGLVVSWCGMRGLVTLAAALALPAQFPQRDLVVLSAFGVVLGTLVVQGLTLGPLINWLKFEPDPSLERELSRGRVALLEAALGHLEGRDERAAGTLRELYGDDREAARRGEAPRAVSPVDKLRREVLGKKRQKLAELRRQARIGDDVFHLLELELDWAELAATPVDDSELIEG